MNHQEIQNELLQVRKEIAELPPGYISKKNINGKTRYYLQWVENGKKKSKYVDDVFADDLRAKIEKRRNKTSFQNRSNAWRKFEKLRSGSRELQKEESL